ncbi:MAG TPA: hypothetical protein V6C78_17135 [Crinalium sp.]
MRRYLLISHSHFETDFGFSVPDGRAKLATNGSATLPAVSLHRHRFAS